MKSNKSLLIAAAVAGALAATPLVSYAGNAGSSQTPGVEKAGCSGKNRCGGKSDKESCSAKKKGENRA